MFLKTSVRAMSEDKMNASTRERCSNEAKGVDAVTVASTFKLLHLFVEDISTC